MQAQQGGQLQAPQAEKVQSQPAQQEFDIQDDRGFQDDKEFQDDRDSQGDRDFNDISDLAEAEKVFATLLPTI